MVANFYTHCGSYHIREVSGLSVSSQTLSSDKFVIAFPIAGQILE